MKQKDVALIGVIVIISAVISIFISKALFPPQTRKSSVEVVGPISADFQQLSSKYFNSSAVNPTKTIKIGDNPNPAPFNSP